MKILFKTKALLILGVIIMNKRLVKTDDEPNSEDLSNSTFNSLNNDITTVPITETTTIIESNKKENKKKLKNNINNNDKKFFYLNKVKYYLSDFTNKTLYNHTEKLGLNKFII